MNNVFDALHPDSRVWIFTSDQLIEDQTKENMLKDCSAFLGKWAAHGSELKAAADLREGFFLIIAADESFQMASGCSIDSAVRFVQDLGQQYKLNFFDRTNLMFNIGGKVQGLKMNQLTDKIAQGFIKPSSLYYNTNISTLKELDDNWLVKAEESWLKRYFNAVESV